jgi:CBS domain-containing protein/hemerythrin superfamily protein
VGTIAKRSTDEREVLSVDAIVLLKDDHATVKRLFREFERGGSGPSKKKQKVVDQIIEELSRHAFIEEEIFYPEARAEVAAAEDTVLESVEEHHIVAWTLSELQDMPPEDERYEAKVSVLMELVREHIKEEEGDLFPKVRKALGRSELRDLGERMEQAKKRAPSRPQPKSDVDQRTTATPSQGRAKGRRGRAPQMVEEVMSKDPLTISTSSSIAEAARLMREADAGAMIVVDEGEKVEGILTDRDIAIRAVAEDRDPSGTRVGEIASTDLETLSPGSSLKDAVRLMRERAVRRLPVVESGRPVGIVSIGDLAIERDPESALADISRAPGNP